MTLGSHVYALLGLTALVAGLVAILVFAMLRFAAAARATHQRSHGSTEMALLSSALEQAVARLKAQERATAARAEASEHLSGEIIASITAGLLVVGMNREIRILNPAGRRMLELDDLAALGDYHRALAEPLSQMIDRCLATGAPILRSTVTLPRSRGATYLGVTVSPLTDTG